MLKKSGNKCSHCGKKLSVDKMTVEHVVPLSKGGTNSDMNLVALCESCNKKKVSYVVDPNDYYPYLKPKYMKELEEYFERYSFNNNFCFVNGFLKTDFIKVPYVKYVCSNGRPYPFSINAVSVFKKAVYSDLDGIYYFLKDYYNSFGRSISPDELKEEILLAYTYGAILFVSGGWRGISVVVTLLPNVEVCYVGDVPTEMYGLKSMVYLNSNIVMNLSSTSRCDNYPKSNSLLVREIVNTLAYCSILTELYKKLYSYFGSDYIFNVMLNWYKNDVRVKDMVRIEFGNGHHCSGIFDVDDTNMGTHLSFLNDSCSDKVDTCLKKIKGSRFIYDKLCSSHVYDDFDKEDRGFRLYHTLPVELILSSEL